jgi:hypothetical protein
VDAFGLAEVVLIVPGWRGGYFLLGMRSLFLRSGWGREYIGSGARSGSYTRGSVRDGSVRSSHSTG